MVGIDQPYRKAGTACRGVYLCEAAVLRPNARNTSVFHVKHPGLVPIRGPLAGRGGGAPPLDSAFHPGCFLFGPHVNGLHHAACLSPACAIHCSLMGLSRPDPAAFPKVRDREDNGNVSDAVRRNGR